ncbi:C3HC4-type RING finger protein [Hirschfeldia incana]|nr:C3HC4-type RING finger protein [Hirschfeldia incana]
METVTRDIKVHIDVNVLLNTTGYLNTACINLFHKLQRHVVDESDGTINCIGLYPAPPLPVPYICMNLFRDKTSSQDLFSRLDSHLHNPYLSLLIVERMAEQAAQNNGFQLKPYLMTVNVVLVQDMFHKIPVSCFPGKETLKKETTCAICLEDLWTNKQLKLPHCSHQFHFRCISKWLQSRNSCPLCREIVFENSDFE